MIVTRAYVLLAATISVLLAMPVCSRAGSFAEGVVEATKPAIAVGVAAAYLGAKDSPEGLARAARTADAALVSYAIAETLKPNLVVNKDRSFRHSFPSGHTTVAFATASSLADIYPKQKWLLYAGAGLVGWSTVDVNGHTWADVAAGAVLGTAVGKWSISSPNGLMIGRVFRY